MGLSRRDFIKHGLALLSLGVSIPAFAQYQNNKPERRKVDSVKCLSLPFALHTDECNHKESYPSPYPIYGPLINNA